MKNLLVAFLMLVSLSLHSADELIKKGNRNRKSLSASNVTTVKLDSDPFYKPNSTLFVDEPDELTVEEGMQQQLSIRKQILAARKEAKKLTKQKKDSRLNITDIKHQIEEAKKAAPSYEIDDLVAKNRERIAVLTSAASRIEFLSAHAAAHTDQQAKLIRSLFALLDTLCPQ